MYQYEPVMILRIRILHGTVIIIILLLLLSFSGSGSGSKEKMEKRTLRDLIRSSPVGAGGPCTWCAPCHSLRVRWRRSNSSSLCRLQRSCPWEMTILRTKPRCMVWFETGPSATRTCTWFLTVCWNTPTTFCASAILGGLRPFRQRRPKMLAFPWSTGSCQKPHWRWTSLLLLRGSTKKMSSCFPSVSGRIADTGEKKKSWTELTACLLAQDQRLEPTNCSIDVARMLPFVKSHKHQSHQRNDDTNRYRGRNNRHWFKRDNAGGRESLQYRVRGTSSSNVMLDQGLLRDLVNDDENGRWENMSTNNHWRNTFLSCYSRKMMTATRTNKSPENLQESARVLKNLAIRSRRVFVHYCLCFLRFIARTVGDWNCESNGLSNLQQIMLALPIDPNRRQRAHMVRFLSCPQTHKFCQKWIFCD